MEKLYNIRVIASGNEHLEVYYYGKYHIREGKEIDEKATKKPYKKHEITEDVYIERHAKTLNTTRNKLIRLARCNDFRYFLTLTYAEEIDLKEAKKKLNILFTQLRRDYKGIKYIYVCEKGAKHGRLHHHILLDIEFPKGICMSKEKKTKKHQHIEESFKNKYWSYGFIDLRKLDENNTDVALYLAKYISKSNSFTEKGVRYYGCSKNLNKPIEVKCESSDSIEEFIHNLNTEGIRYNIRFSNSYEIKWDDYKGKCTYFDLEKEGR